MFSATATFSAFVLPAFIVGTVKTETLYSGPIWFLKVYTAITIFCALYHSLYRVKTIAFDLDLPPLAQKFTKLAANLLILAGTITILTMLIFN